jgi:nicotinamidase-related amidase
LSNSALLVMDVQVGIVARFPGDEDYLPRLRRTIDAAHAAGVPVIFVQVTFRDGYPEVSRHNRSFAAIRERAGMAGVDMAIHPDVAPAEGDLVVTKRRVSAFAGSDLDVLLRAGEIRELVLTGIATSGVVLSTLRQAADLDFELTVLADGCLDADEEVHRVLTTKVFPRQSDVTTVDEWIARLA